MRAAILLERALETGRTIAARLRGRLLALRGARVAWTAGVGARVRVDRPWCVTLDERCTLEADVWIKVVSDSARVVLGSHAFLGRGTELDVAEELSIGAHTLVAPRCFLTDHEHVFASDDPIDRQGCRSRPVRVGADCWLGTGTTVLPGVSVGDRAIVGAGAVVTASVPSGAVFAGVPARPLARRRA